MTFRKPLFRKYFIAEKSWDDHQLILVKSLSYMNLSGSVLVPLLEKFHLSKDELLIAVDQMDLEPGRAKLKPKGSNAGHNGLKSVEAWLESSEYKRLYLGIGRPSNATIVDHVLGIPDERDSSLIRSRLKETVPVVLKVFTSGWDSVLNEINSRNSD